MSSTRFRFLLTLVLSLSIAISTPLAALAAGPGQVGFSTTNPRPMDSSFPHLVTQIAMSPHTPNVLVFGEKVNIAFNYSTTEAGGVQIFMVPYTGAVPTPNMVYSGSPIYPVGSGTGTNYFSVTKGAVTVNRLRITIWNVPNTIMLFSTFLPVNYQFMGAPNIVDTLTIVPVTTSNILKFGQNVNLRFKYTDNQDGGVRIFARPMTGGALTANYLACASPVYPMGSGAGSCNFTITTGAVTVDHIQLQMWNASVTVMLFQALVPVGYQYMGNRNQVYSLGLAPLSPNILMFGQNVTVNFSYLAGVAGGVRIFARPMTGASLTPNYAACGSPIYPTGTGSGSCTFTISSGTAVVDRIRIQMWNATQTILLFQGYINVYYQFR